MMQHSHFLLRAKQQLTTSPPTVLTTIVLRLPRQDSGGDGGILYCQSSSFARYSKKSIAKIVIMLIVMTIVVRMIPLSSSSSSSSFILLRPYHHHPQNDRNRYIATTHTVGCVVHAFRMTPPLLRLSHQPHSAIMTRSFRHQRYHSFYTATNRAVAVTTTVSTMKNVLVVFNMKKRLSIGGNVVRYISSHITGSINENNDDTFAIQHHQHEQNSNHTSTLLSTTNNTQSLSYQRLLSSTRHIPPRVRSIFVMMTSMVSIVYNTINHSILLQLCLLMVLYIFHLTILSQHAAIICWNTMAIGYDSLVGGTIGLLYMIIKMIHQFKTAKQQQSGIDSVSSSQLLFPWNLPRPQLPDHLQHSTRDNIETMDNINDSGLNKTIAADSLLPEKGTKNDGMMIRHRLTKWINSKQPTQRRTNNMDYTWIRFRISMILTCGALVKAYYQTGRYSLFWEDLLYGMSAAGWPLTIPLSRSIQVLAGHLTWVAAGCTILWALPRPPPFFQSLLSPPQSAIAVSNPTAINGKISNQDSRATPYRWFQLSLRDCNWLWWTIGGYYVSSWLFNIADVMNRNVLPLQVLQEATESVVTQLVQPEQNDIIASMIGYIAPCISAPVWEELLYRGFLLAGLTSWTGSYHVSCIVQAIIFSAHHMSITISGIGIHLGSFVHAI
jgi:membrane protease YdiL (CAAX protease family)